MTRRAMKRDASKAGDTTAGAAISFAVPRRIDLAGDGLRAAITFEAAPYFAASTPGGLAAPACTAVLDHHNRDAAAD